MTRVIRNQNSHRLAPKWISLIFALVLLAVFPASVANSSSISGRLIVLTSFPDALFESYTRAFQALHPNLTIHVLNKKTSAAISYVQDKSSRQVDLVWASAPDAFEVLKQSGHLRKLDPELLGPLKYVADYPLNDPNGYYAGFAISGYGIMWNSNYLEKNNLPKPRKWEDLTRPAFADHVAITAPSRSGTTHLITEIILQSKGWESGWSLMLEMAGNLATVTARSYGVRDGIRAGRFAAGPVVDFFGLSSLLTGDPVGFTYPKDTVLLPANIAVVIGAKNVDAATEFIRFLKSEQGQRILLKPDISRLPVLPEVYRNAPDSFPNPFNKSIETNGLKFDSDLSRRRYHLVNSLYDNLITYQLAPIKLAWSSLRRAEAEIESKPNPDPELSLRLASARELLTRIPASATQSQDMSFAGQFSRRKPGFAVSDHQGSLESKWLADAKARYSQAKEIAEEVYDALRRRSSESQTQ